MSFARWAAQLHGGTVQVIDDPRGVNFEIVLPCYPQIAEQGNTHQIGADGVRAGEA